MKTLSHLNNISNSHREQTQPLEQTEYYQQSNNTGIPDNIKKRYENLSGFSFDDVHVHYNSDKPAQLQALAYTQGNQIYIGSGQRKYLEHELGHIIQQKEGRVMPTKNVNGFSVNDNDLLEKEADTIQHSTELEPILHYKENTQTKNNKFSKSYGKTNYNLIQLKPVKRKIGEWYSEYNPFKMFTSEDEAEEYENILKTTRLNIIKARVPTLYTYTHTKPENDLSYALQGPHTVAHKLGWDALIKAETDLEVCNIFNKQILTPNNMKTALKKEEPKGGYSKQITPRLDRWLKDYEEYYNNFKKESTKASPDLIELKDYLNHLLNMDLYATYGWKTIAAKSASRSLKGKGESVRKHTFKIFYDKPSKLSIRNAAGLKTFVDNREDLYNDTYS